MERLVNRAHLNHTTQIQDDVPAAEDRAQIGWPQAWYPVGRDLPWKLETKDFPEIERDSRTLK